MRDHEPLKIEDFNGLWRRGGQDSCPIDHFTDCNNIKYVQSGFKWRDGIGPHYAQGNVARIYIFNQSLLILDKNGNIYHNDRPNASTPILHLDGMSDFVFAKYANRAYITPIGLTDSLYVYTYGDTNGARKAGGNPPTDPPALAATGSGNVEQGIHVFAVVYETNSGFLTSLSPRASVSCDGTTEVSVTMPVSPDSFVSARWIVATRAIDPADFTGNLDGYQFFFVKRVADNTTTVDLVNFYDAELLRDASYLFDLYAEIPNTLGVGLFHNRLVAWASPRGNGGEHLSEILVSNVGEPESFDQVTGLIALPRDGKPITSCQELRGQLYVGKSSKTIVINDNNNVPSSWPFDFIDQGIGPGSAHGIATIMDSGGVNIDFLLVAHYAGLSLFNGTYQYPELSWKIEDIWPRESQNIQVVVDSYNKMIYVVLPDHTMLIGDYKNGLDPMKIRWSPWSFDVQVTTVAILEETGNNFKLIIGSKDVMA